MKNELIICLGPICSGKSTWSLKYLEDNPKAMRFCFDEFLLMCKGNGNYDTKIKDKSMSAIFGMLMEGNTVVDGFPLESKDLSNMIAFAEKTTIRLFDVSFAESVKRNIKRKEKFGKFVQLDEMKRYYGLYKNFLESPEFHLLKNKSHIVTDSFSEVNSSLVM